MSSDERFDAWLAEGAGEAPEPNRAAEDAAVDAVLRRHEGRTRFWILPLAAAALLLVGVGLGRWWGRNGAPDEAFVPTAASADHERKVFDEVRRSLGEELAWLASNEGQITLGLTREAPEAELRVVFLELRDAKGETWARPRVVVPDGKETEIRLAGLPTMRVRATQRSEERIEVACRLDFDDGLVLGFTPMQLVKGRPRLFWGDEDHDAPVALVVSVY